MAKYRIFMALLSGAGASSVSLLLLAASQWAPSTVLLTILLLPGLILADVIWRPGEFDPPLAVLAMNALVYSAIAYGVLSALTRNVAVGRMRLATIWLAGPVTIAIGLACIPALNPLSPRGMTELAKQEEGLQQALPLGMRLDDARTALRSRGIQLPAGHLLALDSNVVHDVEAREESVFLLTVAKCGAAELQG